MIEIKEDIITSWHEAKTEKERADLEQKLRPFIKPPFAGAVLALIPEAGIGSIGSRARLIKLEQRMPELIRDFWMCIDELKLFGVHTAARIINQAREKAAKDGVEWVDVARASLNKSLVKKGLPEKSIGSRLALPNDAAALWAQMRKLADAAPQVYGVTTEADIGVAKAMQRFKSDLDVAIRDLQREMLDARRRMEDTVPMMPDSLPSRLDVVRACQQLNIDPPDDGDPFDDRAWSKVLSRCKLMLREYHPDKNKNKAAVDMFHAAEHAKRLLQKYQDEVSKPKANLIVIK